MALPRRRSPMLISFLLFLSCFSYISSAASAVLGIDLGTEYIKAALVKPGIPLEIVLTKDSKRKEVSAVAFKPVQNAQKADFPERVYGSDAIALAARFPGEVYPNLKPLLGQLVENSELLARYQALHPALDIVPDGNRRTAAFRSKAFGKQQEPFTVEELLAMEMQNIRSNAEALAGKQTIIKDVVITVPAHFTAQEIRALELAAELAGLKILGLVSNGLAVGVNYATTRTFPSVNEGGKAENHLIFDMGAGSTSATVLQFQQKTVKDVGKFNKTFQDVSVLATSYDRTLGGDALNALIVEHMLDEFVKSPSAQKQTVAAESVRAHGRAMAKLLKEAERLRQVLSANSETAASFEGLYEDIDFRYKISRSQFEGMASAFAERVQDSVKRALDAAKLTVDDLDSVILHGGATRTPFVQSSLEKVLGNAGKIRSNVNSDEAAVFGAAFRGASLSPSFRVKEIQIKEGTPYSIALQWPVEGKDRRQKLFVPTSQRGLEKQVPFKNLEDFTFTLYQQDSTSGSASEGGGIPIAKIQTQNLTASVAQLKNKAGCAMANITTTLAFRLSQRDGLPEVVYGAVSCELDNTEKKGGVVEDVKGFFGFGGKNEEQKPLTEETSTDSSSTTSESKKSGTASSETQSQTASASADSESKKSREPAKTTETVYLKFTVENQIIPDVSSAELQRMKNRLAAFDASDKSRRLREEALNTLEAFIYRARDLLTEKSFIAASSEAERSHLQTKIQAASEWLYEDGADAGRDELKARLKELKDLIDPIERRREEAVKRPKAVEFLKEALNQTKVLINAVREQVEKANAASSASAESATASQESASTSTTTDQFADLEDTSSSTSTTTTQASPSPEAPLYTAEDVVSLNAAYDSVQEWLSTKLAEQDKLSAQENPVLLSSELEAKSKELNQAVMGMLEKRMRKPSKAKSSSKPKTKSKKGDSAGTKATSTSGQEQATGESSTSTGTTTGKSTVSPESGAAQQSTKAEKPRDKHDEL